MSITCHPDRGYLALFKRTIAAQTHFLGCLIAMAGMIFLLGYAVQKPGASHFWACLVFGSTSVLVFAASAVNHFLSDGFCVSPALESWLDDLDHFAIYFFIAGSYTVILINAVSAPWANILLAAIWLIAVVGVLYTHFKSRLPHWARHRFVYTGLFVMMGWLFIVRIGEVVHNLSSTALLFLVAGGLSYTIGAVIFAIRRPRLFENVFGYHEIWHLAVLLGFGFHYFAILSFYRG